MRGGCEIRELNPEEERGGDRGSEGFAGGLMVPRRRDGSSSGRGVGDTGVA